MRLLNRITDDIFAVAEFFSAEECAAYIQLSEQLGYESAPIATSFGPQLRPDVRNNTRVMFDDVERAEALWQRAAQFVRPWNANWQPIGLNERLRSYRYDIGQQFDWHYDGAYERRNGERSWLTLMIYLNDDFSGGRTSFEKTIVEPRPGMAVFFVHQLRHKGEPVTRGRKYVLRSDVMYRYTSSL